MNPKTFWRERYVFLGLAAGVALIAIGLIVMRTIPRTARNFDLINRQTVVGEWITVIGATAAVASLAGGLTIAFGIGPDFMARPIEGVTIDEKIETLPDGSPVFNDTPEDIPLKHYLRLRMRDGEVIECRCSREVYHACRREMRGTARMIGERLVSFKPLR